MDSKAIIQALQNKHRRDVFVSQCKTGPTWGSRNLRILDVWVLKRSWVNLTTIGYEIKISRSDFLRDKKWREYLPYCHQFYFVCPWGLIQPDEVDGSAGVCWASKNGQKIFIKRHAPERDIDIPPELLIHIIMSRAIIARAREFSNLIRENREMKIILSARKVKDGA